MVRARLKLVSVLVDCDCGARFVAEDLEPQCPFCDRVYSLNVVESGRELKFRATEADYPSSFSSMEALSDNE